MLTHNFHSDYRQVNKYSTEDFLQDFFCLFLNRTNNSICFILLSRKESMKISSSVTILVFILKQTYQLSMSFILLLSLSLIQLLQQYLHFSVHVLSNFTHTCFSNHSKNSCINNVFHLY